LDSGYQIVVGVIVRPNKFPAALAGAVRDADIADVKVETFNIAGTILGCVIGGVVIYIPVSALGVSW
jgi:hypothetical protein